MPLLQAVLVSLGEADAQLLGRVLQVVPETSSSEFQSSEKPHESLGGLAVLEVRVSGLLGSKQGFEGLAGLWVGGEVGADFLSWEHRVRVQCRGSETKIRSKMEGERTEVEREVSGQSQRDQGTNSNVVGQIGLHDGEGWVAKET